MRVLTSAIATTNEQLVAILSTLPPNLPVTVYAEEGGFNTNIERGVRVEHGDSADYPGGFICIEFNE